MLHIVPGPADVAKELFEPQDLFHLFVEDKMIDSVVQFTNVEIGLKNIKYKLSKCTTSQMSANEIKAFLCLLFQSASVKSNHLGTYKNFIWYNEKCKNLQSLHEGWKIRLFAAMYEIWWQNYETREEGIREIWEKCVENCKKWYKPSSYLTVDE